MAEQRPAWAVRPYPNNTYRMQEFVSASMAAIGWPATGDLSSCSREEIRDKLRQTYYGSASSRSLGQKMGIVDRFVNQVLPGDAVVIPDGDVAYFGITETGYTFHPELEPDEEGYPHWIGVSYQFGGLPLERLELPAVLFDSLKGRQTVYGLPNAEVWDVINNPSRYSPVDPGIEQETRSKYCDNLAQGTVPGINSPRFEEAVLKVLALYFPGMTRLATTNAPVGADTDLMASLPGGIAVRVQVKCYQDDLGPLESDAVEQLRGSMEPGEHGILVTTGAIDECAREAADVDAERPIGLMSGEEFVELVFENQERLSDADLWALGLRRVLVPR